MPWVAYDSGANGAEPAIEMPPWRRPIGFDRRVIPESTHPRDAVLGPISGNQSGGHRSGKIRPRSAAAGIFVRRLDRHLHGMR